jgi:hypothetical protein
VEDFDLQVLLQMRRRKICDVECDNRIRLHRHRRRDHVPIFDLHRFEDRRLREFEVDGVWECGIHSGRFVLLAPLIDSPR